VGTRAFAGSSTSRVIRSVAVWSGLGLFAYLGYEFGPSGLVGPVLAYAAFPLLFIKARLMNGTRWRIALHQSLPICVLIYTRAMLLDSFWFPFANTYGTPDLDWKLYVGMERIALFLTANSFSTATALVTLMGSFPSRRRGTRSERWSFLVSHVVICVCLVSVTSVCAFALVGRLEGYGHP
jgi:hypothetical protein